MNCEPGEEFWIGLRAALPSRPGIAVIHNSLPGLMPPRGFDKHRAAYALDKLVREGWTLAIPAFTFGFCGGQPFDIAVTPSEVGILADYAREVLPYALRTQHPIYSFVVLGPRSREIVDLRPETTFGTGSPFDYFEQNDATIIMAGCGWHYNTFFHRFEELARVPYREMKTFVGSADVGPGPQPAEAPMFVRNLEIDAENEFSPAVAELAGRGDIRTVELWRGSIQSASAERIAEVCRSQLDTDALAYVRSSATVAYKLANWNARKQNPTLRVAVLGRSNVEILKAELQTQLKEVIVDQRIDLYTVPFGQLAQGLIDPKSELRGFDPQHLFFADRLEDLIGASELRLADEDMLRSAALDYAELIRSSRSELRGRFYVARFAALGPQLGGREKLSRLVAQLNEVMDSTLHGVEDLFWFDPAPTAAAIPAPAYDPRLWHLGRFPFSKALSQALAGKLCGLLLAATGRTARLLVLDLDNTLWGGVLGEDGIEGIQIGGDYPGNAFAAFQSALCALSDAGIALAVASKNDEDLAIKAIDEHPAMQIRSANLVTRRINWLPKPENIRSICDELSLGLNSVLFVDDNPVEREAVRRALPGVKVLNLPEDPSLYAEALAESPFLSILTLTSEDQRRVKDYKARAEVMQRKASAHSLEDFYASLDMHLHVQPLEDANIARAAQLCAKTNQFNTTTRRYDAADLRAAAGRGDEVAVLGLSDRDRERENIGLIVLKANEDGRSGTVDLYLLSCRVLGRGLETAVLSWALRRARELGWDRLDGLVIETERNTPVREVFAQTGFTAGDVPGTWSRNTADLPEIPAWLQLHDPVSERV